MRYPDPLGSKSIVFALMLVLAGALVPARAQQQVPRANPRPPLRIEIVPRGFYRQCVDWHDVEHRPTGDVIVPRTRCRWAPR